MKVLFHLGHPAHFHLFKNVIKKLHQNGHATFVLIKKKDVLEQLLVEHKFEYHNILPDGRKDSKVGIAIGQLKQDYKVLKFSLKHKPDLLIGTSVAISHVGKLLGIPSVNVNEDDADVVPLYAKLAYPLATTILAPKVCRLGKWSHKAIFYNSYHELAYLHPSHFKANKQKASKYVSFDKPIFIIRFARLGAHHDVGIRGISNEVANRIIEILKPFGNVYITSERELTDNLEQYRIQIKPSDMHDVMAFSSMYIGDSQTMAAEAGVLGIPFIRFNDFVGRISYLDELENRYKLGFGIKTSELENLFQRINELLIMENREMVFQERRKKMLSEKIDFAAFLIWFVESYPKSKTILKDNPDYQYNFK